MFAALEQARPRGLVTHRAGFLTVSRTWPYWRWRTRLRTH
jgi:hypothetical protein